MRTETLDRPAERVDCERCGRPTLLRPGGQCADCIGDIELHHPDEHAEWLVQVKARTEA